MRAKQRTAADLARLVYPGASEAGNATTEAAKTDPGVGWHQETRTGHRRGSMEAELHFVAMEISLSNEKGERNNMRERETKEEKEEEGGGEVGVAAAIAGGKLWRGRRPSGTGVARG